MINFLNNLKQNWENRPFVLNDSADPTALPFALPSSGKVLMLAPHPDDPESAAVLGRMLKLAGCEIRWTIVCTSPNGVEDEYTPADKKSEIRRKEQRNAASMFGLDPDRLEFLGLGENGDLDTDAIKAHLFRVAPDLVILPTGKDTNRTHQKVHQAFWEAGTELGNSKPVCGLYNEDPKTAEMRRDLFVLFDEERANWKAGLLRAHDSQQQRNMRARGIGFDQRILEVNRKARSALPDVDAPASGREAYAECYEIELFEPSALEP